MAMTLDESLLYLREVTRYIQEEGGYGYMCDLECGHTVRLELEPPIGVHCGYCLEKLVSQIREVQAAQRIK